ncbi:hypothetical protein GTY87_00470 [Streptomyces sp. SID7813]|uniref:Uncharacterized protein n=1 Tax=Streptomyces coelicolor (strain ATCC BAA-471 / A3(2) / M145) TaxID=100226 RepID=Q9RI69_STRCO|nr:hypothetical protein [Streptomyces sp. SID7813]QFI40419.1 hypothetical protein FQ762_00490 [Streptomyces coelicolor A3(2)]THA87303.1 hypothetical protein E6R61_30335 [Streptomyces sp. LRa12]CAB52922.1 hypothetical protein [Streptomyces coelicolor A3(2)]
MLRKTIKVQWLGDEEFGMVGRPRAITHDPESCEKTVSLKALRDPCGLAG